MDWNPYEPLAVLPLLIQTLFRDEAHFLYDDLRANQLQVVLMPAPNPQHPSHKIRVAQGKNPGWYSRLYAEHPHFRRDRSLRALERIVQQLDKLFIDRKCRAVRYKYHYKELRAKAPGFSPQLLSQKSA